MWLYGILVLSLGAAAPSRLEWLRQEIDRHDTLYFQQASPEISDYEYDQLKAELRALEQAARVDSSARVGSDLRGDGEGGRHGRPMLSLDKAYTEDEVGRFLERLRDAGLPADTALVIEPKYDGVALNVRMVRGEVAEATTRGDGHQGEVVTAALAAIQPMGFPWAEGAAVEQIELRGEVYLSQAAWARLNAARAAAGDVVFRHPRSVAAGSIRLEDPDEIAARGLAVVWHGWGEVRPASGEPESVSSFGRWLDARGLSRVGPTERVALADAGGLTAAIARVRAGATAFPTDGVVIKVDDVSAQRRLGESATAPRWALARKFVPPQAETTLRAIRWQVGRSGVLTPVAEFEAVQLEGTTVARASLHTAAEVQRRDLRIGDRVVVEKAGQVVPAIVGVRQEKRTRAQLPYALPGRCPVCTTGLSRAAEDGELYCENEACPAQVALGLVHFGSRGALSIRGLGEAMAMKLVTAELVRDPSDLYGLSEAQLVALPGVGVATARTFLAEIEQSRTAARWRVLVGSVVCSGNRGRASIWG